MEHILYRADMTSGMAAGLSKSGRMTLRHRTQASTTMAAEKCIRLSTFSSKSLKGEELEACTEGCLPRSLAYHPTSRRVAMMIVSTSSIAVSLEHSSQTQFS